MKFVVCSDGFEPSQSMIKICIGYNVSDLSWAYLEGSASTTYVMLSSNFSIVGLLIVPQWL